MGTSSCFRALTSGQEMGVKEEKDGDEMRDEKAAVKETD